MTGLRAYVKNGRLVLDEPTSLPEGTVIDLVADDEGDDLDEEQRRARDEAVARAWESAQAGRGTPVDEVIAKLRKRR
jgi:hypothetical protein